MKFLTFNSVFYTDVIIIQDASYIKFNLYLIYIANLHVDVDLK